MLVLLALLHFVILNMRLSKSRSAFPVNFMVMLIACGYCSAQCDHTPTGLTVPAILFTNSEPDGRLLYHHHFEPCVSHLSLHFVMDRFATKDWWSGNRLVDSV